ncbi:MAG: anthranilate/aminodeoxychorismate synthase component II, partial [Bacteroidota bacterium]
MTLVIDNYDSFTFNLVQLLGKLGSEVRVFRNDQASVEELKKLRPERVVISPGPGRPEDA